MPTKILVVESANFQLGANAGPDAEKIEAAAFPPRLKAHGEAAKSGTNELLFVIAPAELRLQSAFAEATASGAPVSIAFCDSAADAFHLLPILPTLSGETRSTGVKTCLQKGSVIHSETFFNAKAVGTRLDPCYVFARGRLPAAAAANAWACLQSLVFLGIQHLPEYGERESGEKVDAQLGADETFLAFTVRFDLEPEQFAFLLANPILMLPKASAGLMETRYLESERKLEFSCLFFRGAGPTRPIEITTWHRSAQLEGASEASDYVYKNFAGLSEAAPETLKKAGGGFKKKFSDRVKSMSSSTIEVSAASVVSPGASVEAAIRVAGSAESDTHATKVSATAETVESATTVKSASDAAAPSVVVSGGASLGGESVTVVKGDAAYAKVAELEAKVKGLEAQVKTRDELLTKAAKEASDPTKKRDVLSGLKDSQTEGLKQNIKLLETELEEMRGREKELMKMVDKSVQMKDEAAKKLKELDLKLKAQGAGGSKLQMLEKGLDEQKRQNKELLKRLTELTEKTRAA